MTAKTFEECLRAAETERGEAYDKGSAALIQVGWNASRAALLAERPEVDGRITAYLACGGLFNPELANHDAVRDLLIDCRAALESLAAQNAAQAEEIAILKNSDVGMLRAQMHSDLQMFEEEIAKVRAAYTASIQRENDLLDEIAKLKGHAEARDVEIIRLSAHAASLRKYIETDAFECPTAVADYDRDYPEE